MFEIIDQGILSRQPGRGAFMPVITSLSDGALIAAQHVGSSLGAPDCRIEVLRTSDGGRSWTNEGDILCGVPDDGWAYRGPEISVVADGRLLMTATRFEYSEGKLFDPESEALQRPELLALWSPDQGRTWSDPQVVPVPLPPEKYTCNGAGRFLQMAPDRWLYFLETWKPVGYAGPPDQKAALLVSHDEGKTWGEFTVVADDPTGALLYWDQLGCVLPDGRIYNMFWMHKYGTSEDLPNHWSVSADQGRSWSPPKPTNLRGQVCAPIALPDGRVAAVYNYRHEPQGICVAISEDLEHFDVEHQVIIFDAGTEASMGEPESDNFLAEHMQIAFGKPAGHLCEDGTILISFWCTAEGVTHTRWVRLGYCIK